MTRDPTKYWLKRILSRDETKTNTVSVWTGPFERRRQAKVWLRNHGWVGQYDLHHPDGTVESFGAINCNQQKETCNV